MLETLERLCKLDGVSGNEASVREFIINEIKDFCDYKIDNLGNIDADRGSLYFKKSDSETIFGFNVFLYWVLFIAICKCFLRREESSGGLGHEEKLPEFSTRFACE